MPDDDQNTTPSIPNLPTHAFISYAHADEVLAHRIREVLSMRGVPTWIDWEGLQPGTPDWEAAIEDAINRSFCVIFLATPASAVSSATHEELRLAREAQVDIFPLWAAGRKWEIAAPPLVEKTQYIDGRGRRKLKAGIARLADTVSQTVERKALKHFVLTERMDLPPGYLLIEVNGRVSVAIRQASYATLGHLLNDLYVYYLYHDYQPQTYGSRWVLASARTSVSELADVGKQLIVPWEWLSASMSSPPLDFALQWDTYPLRRYNLVSGTAWRVEPFQGEHLEQLFGIVADEYDPVELLRSYAALHSSRVVGKSIHSLFDFGHWYPADTVRPENFSFTGVYTYGRPITHGGMAFFARDDPRAHFEAARLSSRGQEP